MARLSDQKPGNDPESMVVPALGLVAEAGSLVDIFKKWLRDGITFDRQRDFARVELGDVLWYLANLASRFDLSLNEIAENNLNRTRNRYGFGPDRWNEEDVKTSFDNVLPVSERFPRRMVFHFEETQDPDGQWRAVMRLLEATPNPFPHGRQFTEDPKGRGFTVGDPLRNNSLRDDGYRYHDAIHISFMAVLGWSPVMRSLLRLKRKSRVELDDVEDGARAVDIEEGLASQLAVRASKYEGYKSDRVVDNGTLDIVLEHTSGLEVSRRPGWLWKLAISTGFQCLESLKMNHGGYLVADLEAREVEYSRLRPEELGDKKLDQEVAASQEKSTS